jgi:hypothetical protein
MVANNVWESICLQLGLEKMAMSEAMYGGKCPICGAEKSFFVWTAEAPLIKAICYECKVKIKIRAGGWKTWPSPF